MPYYVILGNFTDEGIRNIKDSPKRLSEIKAAVEKAGLKMLGFYYTFGQYDFVSIVEGDDDKTAMSLLLMLGSKGYVRTSTLKAFSAEEASKIIEALP